MGAKQHWTKNQKTKVVTATQLEFKLWLWCLSFVLLAFLVQVILQGKAFASTSGCEEAQVLQSLAELSQSPEDTRQLSGLVKNVCPSSASTGVSQIEVTGDSQSVLKYDNGNIATYWQGSAEAEWYYPNGKLATKGFKKGQALYYPNGRVATEWSFATAVPWFHPNGKVMIHAAGVAGADVYGPAGELLVASAGPLLEQKKINDLDMIAFIQEIRWRLALSSFHALL